MRIHAFQRLFAAWRRVSKALPMVGLCAVAGGYFPGEARAQTVAWEARWDGGMVEPYAEALLVATGPTGTVYATGTVRNGTFRDILTLAWSASGQLLWHRTKGTSSDSDDVPAGILLDSNGNVVIAGTSKRAGMESVLLFAYGSNGTLLWSRTHTLSAFRQNQARGLALGPADQIVVAAAIGNGSIQGTSLTSFDSAGDLLWERQRNLDPAHGALAFAPGGAIALGGRAVNPIGFDFLTVAFDAAGNELWARTKDGSAARTDSLTGLIVDSNGRFVVTGSSDTLSSEDDFMSVAYDANGNELWAAVTGTQEHETPTAITADNAGNVYVVGIPSVVTANHYSLAVSYDSAGVERWAVTNLDPPDASSVIYDATVSAEGDLIVVGFVSSGILPMSRLRIAALAGDSGATLWEEVRIPSPGYRESAIAVASDPTGALVVVGNSATESSLSDALVARYDSTGTELWARKEPMIPAQDVPGTTSGSQGKGAITTGYDGRVYITGTSFDGVTHDFLTVAYDGLGHKLWEARKSNPDQNPALPIAIAVDSLLGNVYVLGTTWSSGVTAYLTVAYDRYGGEIWSRTRALDEFGAKYPCCMAIDASGLIFVTGFTAVGENGTSGDILTVAYEQTGNEVWTDRWGLDQFSFDRPYALTIGSTGILYVAGISFDPQGGPARAVTLAYQGSGNRLWAATHEVDPDASAWFTALAPTPDGGVVATGATSGTGFEDVLTVAYRPDGSERWSAIADSTDGGYDFVSDVEVDSAGRSYVTGSTWNPDSSDPDFLTVAYDPMGAILWQREYAGAAGGEDLAGSLAIGSQGTIFVTGKSSNGSDSDFLTLAYTAGGFERLQHRYDAGSEDEGYLAIAGPDGSVFVGGSSVLNDSDFFLFKLLDDSGLFADGFAGGDTSAWSTTEP